MRRLILLLLLIPASLAQWDNGYYFPGGDSFAELPANTLCDKFHFRIELVPRESNAVLFVAFNTRLQTMIILQAAKPFFKLSILDNRRQKVDQRRLDASINMPYMFSEWKTLHETEIRRTSLTTMSFRVDRISKTVHLHGTAFLFPMEEIRNTRFFLSRPSPDAIAKDDHWIYQYLIEPNYKGYFRNALGMRDCDCAQTRRLNLVASNGLNISKMEPCEKKNPCDVGCLCISYAFDATCECENTIKCPDFAPFDHRLPMDHMLGQRVTNKAGLTATATKGVVVGAEHAVSGKSLRMNLPGSELRISEPPDARSCFSHLAKCEKGLTLSVWLRMENPTLHRPNTIFRQTSPALCAYGISMTHSVTDGLRVIYRTQAGYAFVLRSTEMVAEQWVHVVVQVPDTNTPFVKLFINGRLQKDPSPTYLNSTLLPGQMIKCRSDLLILGNVTGEKSHGPDGVHFLMIDDLEMKSPMLPESFLAKFDLYHYDMATAGTYGEVYQLQALSPKLATYKFTTKGVVKVSEDARENSLLLSPVTDGVLTLWSSPATADPTLCLFNFESCLNGIYLSVWLKIGAAAKAAPNVRLFQWNGLEFRLRKGRPSLYLNIAKESWSITDVNETVATHRWVFVESSWDRHNGLEVFIDRNSKGTAKYKNDPSAVLNVTNSSDSAATLILGANVKFQLDDLQLRTAGRQALIQMERVRLDNPERLKLSFDEIKNRQVTSSSRQTGSVIGDVGIVPAKIKKGIQLRNVKKKSYIDMGASFNHYCIGNINHCPNGIYVSFWLRTDGILKAAGSTLLTTGYSGITITWKDDAHLAVEARTLLKRWQVGMERPLTTKRFHFVEISWDQRMGLRLFCDLRQVGVDILPSLRVFTAKDIYQQNEDRVLVGNWRPPFPKTGAVVLDELQIWAANREFLSNWKHVALQVKENLLLLPAPKPKQSSNVTATKAAPVETLKMMMMAPEKGDIVYPQYAMVPFEWRLPDGRIPNTRLDVRLHGRAKLVSNGRVGAGLSLSAKSRDFVTLGQHYDCYGNLDSCPSGLTIRFWMVPTGLKSGKKVSDEKPSVVLASRSYEIFIGSGQRLNFVFKALGKIWTSREYRVKQNWQFVEASWSVQDGLRVYVDTMKKDVVPFGVPADHQPLRDDATIYISRPGAFCDLAIDELELWQSPIDFLMEHDFVYASRRHLRFPLSGDDSRIVVSGKPRPVVGVRGLGQRLPGRLDFGTAILCQEDDLSLCPDGMTIRLWVRLDEESARTAGVLSAGDAVSLTLIEGRLKGHVWSHGREWRAESRQTMKTGLWYLVELSWQREGGLLLLVNTWVWAGDHVPRKQVIRRREMGSLVVGDGKTGMTVDELEVWNSKFTLVLFRGQMNREADRKHLLSTEAQSDEGHEGKIQYLRFTGDNFLRYNFSGLRVEKSDLERLRIEFSSNQPNGLLWLGRENTSVHMLFLDKGVLHLRLMYMRPTGEMAVRDFRMKKQAVNDGKRHTVELLRTRRTTLLTADEDRNKDQLIIKTNIKIHLRPRDLVYLGGLPDASAFGISDLNGNIYKARVEYDWGRSLDLIGDLSKIPHSSSNGPKVYVMKAPPTKPPPKSKNPFDMSKVNKHLRGVVSGTKVAYTFYTSGARLYMDSWNFPMMKSIEFEFMTFEPQGLIFYIGAGMHAKSFVALEIFDRLLYSVYSAGSSIIRTQLNEFPVNMGHKHILKLSIFVEGYITIVMNGVKIPIPRAKNPERFDFDSYTYVGGVDVYNKKNTRLPWQVWSRSGFIGCMTYIQFNGEGYYDARGYQAQHAFPDRDIGKCTVPKYSFCNHPSDCTHGVCHKRWATWKEKTNFHCDCSLTGFTYPELTDPTMMQHEVYGQKCSKPSTELNGNGRDGREVIFSPKILSTHTDHITLEFKTKKKDVGLFLTSVPASPIYLKAFLSGGRVYVTTNVYTTLRAPASKTYRIGQSVYSDDKWHKLAFMRRANDTTFWMDNEEKKGKEKLPYSPTAYYFIAKQIRMGTFNKTLPPFVGKMRNFYWNAYDFINFPTQPRTYHTVYFNAPRPKSAIPMEPSPLNITHPVTVKNGTYFILSYGKFFYDPKKGASVEVVFRTDEPDVMVLHMDNGDHFITFMLSKGKAVYSFDMGNGKFSPFLPREWKNLNDQTWHQLFISITPEEEGRKHRLWLDQKLVDLGKFSHIPKALNVYLGGVARTEREKRDTAHIAVIKNLRFVGCFGKADVNGRPTLKKELVQVAPPSGKTLIFGRCIDPKHCRIGYCKNGGQCLSLDWDKIACSCTVLFEGVNCEKPKRRPNCPRNYCKNGVCVMKYQLPSSFGGSSNKTQGWQPVCDCGTGYYGRLCEKERRCPNDYCSNYGVCTVDMEDRPTCNCSLTGYSGPRCRQKSPGIRILYKRWGYIIVPARPPFLRNLESIAFGFQTFMTSGHLATFMLQNGQSWQLFMRDSDLYLSVSDKREYRIAGPLNDGNYHVISMVRNGGIMDISLNGRNIRRAIFTDIALKPDYGLQYTQVIVGANASFQNVFRGTIGGFFWNGYYIFKGMSESRKRGTVVITLTPVSLPRPVSKDCPKDMCKNCGRCYKEKMVVRCDCYRTGYGGHFCDKAVFYGVWSQSDDPGSVILTVTNSRASFNGDIRFAFQTVNDTGPLVCMVGRSGKYFKMFLRDGFLVLNVNGQDEFFNVGSQRMPLNDGKLKVVTLDRKGSTYVVQIGGCGKQTVHYSDAATTLNQFEVMNIFIGSDCTKFGSKFVGVIGAFNWRGLQMIHSGGGFYQNIRQIGRSSIVRIPFSFPGSGQSGGGQGSGSGSQGSGSKSGGPKRPTIAPGPAVGGSRQKPVLIGIGTASGGVMGWGLPSLITGIILALLLLLVAFLWACIFCKPGCCCACCPGAAGPAKLLLSPPYNQFEKNGGLESLPLIKSNGFESAPPPPLTDLPQSTVPKFESAPPMEPPPPMDDIGKEQTTRFESAPPLGDDDIDLVDRATLDNRKEMTMTKNHSVAESVAETEPHNVHNIHHVHHIHHYASDAHDAGLFHEDDASYRSLSHSNFHHAGFGYHERLDIGFDHLHGVSSSHADTMDGEHQLMEENAFSGELRVNCCQLSRNSHYAVTGSGAGAPEVWNLSSGSLIKVLDGVGFGCSGLHLACKDAVLVGQVHDDSAPWPPILHAWDFVSGRQIDLGKDVVCTALCVTHVGHHVVIARCVPEHDHAFSLLVWDLLTNREIHETHFMPPPGLSPDSGITFLKISLDDRFVVAGYANHFDQQANYMVFDLTLAYAPGTVINPHVVVFDANVDCTEILANNEEAVTGTRTGDLTIWDLHSGRSVRQILTGSARDKLTSSVQSAHGGAIHALAISNDGKLLASASADRLVRSWDMTEEKLQHTMKGHESDVLSVAISEDKELVVSGSDDGSIRVWRLDRDGAQLCWFTSNIAVFHVKLSPNKEVLVALGERSMVRKLIMLKIVRNKERRKKTHPAGPHPIA